MTGRHLQTDWQLPGYRVRKGSFCTFTAANDPRLFLQRYQLSLRRDYVNQAFDLFMLLECQFHMIHGSLSQTYSMHKNMGEYSSFPEKEYTIVYKGERFHDQAILDVRTETFQ